MLFLNLYICLLFFSVFKRFGFHILMYFFPGRTLICSFISNDVRECKIVGNGSFASDIMSSIVFGILFIKL